MGTLVYSRENSLILYTEGLEGAVIIKESKNHSLAETIKKRAESDILSPTWTSDESTGSYAFYRQDGSTLFIPKLELKVTRLDLNSSPKEVWVHPSAREYLARLSTSALPKVKSYHRATDFGKIVNSICGVPLAVGEEYGKKLESTGLESFSLHVLSPERVSRGGDDFLRHIRLKGINSGSFNPGGIVCDGRPYFKRAAAS